MTERSKLIVGLTGPFGCGKDTVGGIIANLFQAKMIAWADELYNQVAAAYGVNVEFLQFRETKDIPLNALCLLHCKDETYVDLMLNSGFTLTEPLSPRVVLQRWGTEYRRAQDPDYWTKLTQVAIEAAEEPVILISGTRMMNEIKLVRSTGGFLLHVSRQGFEQVKTHSSEIDIPFEITDHRISNDGDLADLTAAASEFAESQGMIKRGFMSSLARRLA